MDSIKRKREDLKLEEKRLKEEIEKQALEFSRQIVPFKTLEYVSFLNDFFKDMIDSVSVASQSSLEFTMSNNLQGGKHNKIDFFEIKLKSTNWKLVGHYHHHYYSASTTISLVNIEEKKETVSLESGLSYDLYVNSDWFKYDYDMLKQILKIESGIHIDMFITSLRSFLFHFLEHQREHLGQDSDILRSQLLYKIFTFTFRDQ